MAVAERKEREKERRTWFLELGTKNSRIIWGRGGRNHSAAWYRGAHTCPKWRGGRHIVLYGRISYFFYRFPLLIGGPGESVISFDSINSSWYLLVYFWRVLADMLTKFETKSARVKGKEKDHGPFLSVSCMLAQWYFIHYNSFKFCDRSSCDLFSSQSTRRLHISQLHRVISLLRSLLTWSRDVKLVQEFQFPVVHVFIYKLNSLHYTIFQWYRP